MRLADICDGNWFHCFSIWFCMSSGDVKAQKSDLMIVKGRRVENLFYLDFAAAEEEENTRKMLSVNHH